MVLEATIIVYVRYTSLQLSVLKTNIFLGWTTLSLQETVTTLRLDLMLKETQLP